MQQQSRPFLREVNCPSARDAGVEIGISDFLFGIVWDRGRFSREEKVRLRGDGLAHEWFTVVITGRVAHHSRRALLLQTWLFSCNGLIRAFGTPGDPGLPGQTSSHRVPKASSNPVVDWRHVRTYHLRLSVHISPSLEGGTSSHP